MLDAAAEGLGVALARSGLIEPDLQLRTPGASGAGRRRFGAGFLRRLARRQPKLARVAALQAWLVGEIQRAA